MKPAAQAILLQAYFEKRVLLVRYFTRLTGDIAMAEDIVQDLYVKLSAMRTEPQISDPSAFLFRMAHNLHLNQLRSLSSARKRDGAWHDMGSSAGGEAIDEAPTAEDHTAARQQLQQLARALDELPDKTQSIFRLHKLEALSQAEVATKLGISLSSVEKHLGSALRHLTARLRPRDGP